ncbi:cytochrome C oxidase subunit IV family protein [Halostagnicola kamekurae]|uniref:Cytochrome C oxidase subunit IV n=1 Tax=Halostagnicola kamekurae TaxID=619731 RepID=A0A1I6Q9T1_9EURY|nr:cytochrome C oxidase subunit IV family protein [Halostagnicola kamekurae]SFS49118.1 Cytochrome C oxidase subunit IV [Halostagnicola kamekurae]
MASIRTYSIIYVALLLLGTAQFALFEIDLIEFGYWTALTGVLLFSVAKILLVAGYFQHLIEEPRSITYMMVSALFMVLLLTIAAGFSIQ